MKIKDGLKLKGTPAEIPDCSRDDLPAFFKEMGFKVGAEIGVYKGEFLKMFLDCGLKMYGIDPWLDYSDYRNTKGQDRINFQFEHASRLLSPYKNCTLIRKTSMEALSEFEDESLDFVYIDANHLLRYIIEDLSEWSKKVRKGGIISGHDFILKRREEVNVNVVHVKPALEAFTTAYGIDSWYVLGTEKFIQGQKRDRWRSWLWVKNYNEPSNLVDA